MSCINSHSFDYANEFIQRAYIDAAGDSMKSAATKIKENVKYDSRSGKPLTTLPLDGSWQKRGHSSFNGVVTAISDGY